VLRLEGKLVVVTGATGGMGSLLAAGLRREGARVIGVDQAPCDLCDESIIADLSSEEGIVALAGNLAARPIDILCNVAGIQFFGPYERQELASIWRGYAVNLVAPAMLIRAVLPGMQARGTGQIVSIGSVMGSINYPHFATYSSAKAGLRGLSEGLRRELHGSGIAVTYIAPRAVNTPFNSDQVRRFLDVARMRADEPGTVVDMMVEAIVGRRKDVTVGVAERFYTRLNGVFPRLVDAGLASTTRKARALFD
jgi:short-subunit dehydrogenase